MFPEEKKRALREKGHGKWLNATKAPTVLEKLWKNRVLGEQNPNSLPPYFHFNLWGCQEHHEIFVEDFSLNKDDQGTECVKFEENPIKTQQNCLRKKRRATQPNIFATGGPPFYSTSLNMSFPQT